MNTVLRRLASIAFLSMLVLFVSLTTARAQTTTFTYQGHLTDSAMASGTYDLQFTLYDENNQPIATITRDDVPVVNGVFTVQLDFTAAAFPGANRSLEIAVRRGTETGAYTTLAPRQPITSTPYAIRALNATNADTATTAATATTATNADNLGNVAASNFLQTNTTAFVRNQTTLQAADFNITRTGAANIFNAATQYNIAGNRILSNAGTSNLFAGVGAGNANTGAGNSFFGVNTGKTNTTGFRNSFFGFSAGSVNTTGGDNSFVGSTAGRSNTTGAGNSFFGMDAGLQNSTGGNNSFFGVDAGFSNSTGSNNTLIGQYADVAASNLSFATAIGSGATVGTSNTIALGRTTDRVVVPSGRIVLSTLNGGGSNHLCINTNNNEIANCEASLQSPANADAQKAQMTALQAQVDGQAKQIAEQKAMIEALRALVCSTNANAAVCQVKE